MLMSFDSGAKTCQGNPVHRRSRRDISAVRRKQENKRCAYPATRPPLVFLPSLTDSKYRLPRHLSARLTGAAKGRISLNEAGNAEPRSPPDKLVLCVHGEKLLVLDGPISVVPGIVDPKAHVPGTVQLTRLLSFATASMTKGSDSLAS